LRQPLRRFKADFFKALAHPGRIKILEALREGEKTVSEIQAILDDEPASASQQLAVLRTKDLVVGRKEGTSVYYSVADPLVFDILDAAREFFNNHVTHAQAILEEEEALTAATPGG
jgi:DNA-binding transcriptional ArsR family regulator